MKRSWVLTCILTLLVLVYGTVALAEEVTISLMVRDYVNEEPFWFWAVEEFEKRNPGVKVALYRVPNNDYVDQITVQMLGGVAPDVFYMWGWFATSWAEQGLLLDLRPYVERDLTEEEIADIFPGDWDASFMKWGEYAGEQFGFPRTSNVGLTLYNVQHLQEAGLPDIYEAAAKGNWTFEELRTYGQKLTDETRYGIRLTVTASRLTGYVGSFGGSVVQYEPLGLGLTSSASLDGLDYLRDMVFQDGVVATPVVSWDRRDFQNEMVSISLSSGGQAADLHDLGLTFQWNIAPWPEGPGGRVAWASGGKFGIFRGTKHPEVAWELVKFLAGQEATEKAIEIMGLPPLRRSVAEAYLSLYPGLNMLSHFETLATARITETAFVPEAQEFERIIEEVVDKVFRNNVPAAIAVEEVRPVIDSLLAPYK